MQCVFAAAEPAQTVSSFSLCKHLISLLSASCQPARAVWQLGTNVEPFRQGDVGPTGAQCSADGAEGPACIESCPVPSLSPVLPAGAKKHLEPTPLALPSTHGSYNKGRLWWDSSTICYSAVVSSLGLYFPVKTPQMPWRDAFPPLADVFDSLISFSNKAEAAPAHALDYLFSNLILSRQFSQTEGHRYLTHKLLTSYGQLVGDPPGPNAREKGRAGAGGTHTVPPLCVLASSSISTCSHLLQPGPDTHVSISGAPAPTCPSSLTSSFVNLHLPPRGWLVASSAGTAALLLPKRCQQEQCPVSPNEP